MGCPVLRAFCEGREPRTHRQRGLCESFVGSIVTHPCKERKDGPPAQRPASGTALVPRCFARGHISWLVSSRQETRPSRILRTKASKQTTQRPALPVHLPTVPFKQERPKDKDYETAKASEYRPNKQAKAGSRQTPHLATPRKAALYAESRNSSTIVVVTSRLHSSTRRKSVNLCEKLPGFLQRANPCAYQTRPQDECHYKPHSLQLLMIPGSSVAVPAS